MYSLNKNIPSCHVTLDLLKEIEDYLLRTKTQLNPDTPYPYLRWKIEEGSAVTKLNSISEFRARCFFDPTTEVSLDFDTFSVPGVEVGIRLTRSSAALRVAVKGLSDERERAIGLAESLLDKFKHYSNCNSVYHHHPLMILQVPFLLAALHPILGSAFLMKIWYLVFGVGLTAWLYVYVGSRHLPYAQFASRANDKRCERFWKLHWAFIPAALMSLAGAVYKLFLD